MAATNQAGDNLRSVTVSLCSANHDVHLGVEISDQLCTRTSQLMILQPKMLEFLGGVWVA